MDTSDSSIGQSPETMEEAKDILDLLRKCRSRLNRLNLHHSAAYADIAVQLLKQAIAMQEQRADGASPPISG